VSTHDGQIPKAIYIPPKASSAIRSIMACLVSESDKTKTTIV